MANRFNECYSPLDWPITPLERVISHRKEFIQIDDLSSYKRCRVQVDAKGILLRDIVSGLEVKTKKQQVCKTGDFLVAEIDAKVGGYGIVPQELEGAIVSSHYFLYEIDESVLDRDFLDFYIRIPTFREQVASQGSTNYAAIRPHHVLEYKMPLPPLQEQRRIVGRIEELVAKVEEARGLRAIAQKKLKSFVSATHIHLAADRIVELGQVIELDEKREIIKDSHGYPQVGVRGFGGGLFAKESVLASETKYKHFNQLYEGAIVLSQVKGWEGAIASCPQNLADLYVSPEYRTFRCVQGESIPDYMASLVTTPWFWSQLKDLTRGMGGRRERTRPELFLKMQLPMPTIEQQVQAIQSFKRLTPLKQLQAQTETELNALIPAILDKAFKGEL